MSLTRSPYGRHVEARAAAGPLVPYEGETYYGLPAVRPSHYGWLISSYFFVGGLAGSSQVLATVADVVGGRRNRAIVRAGRYLALAGALASPVFLISDLHTPERWYKMLRLFRKTSAMSIGSWTLTAFGTLSGLVAAGQGWDDYRGAPAGRWLAHVAGLPAAVAGALMSIYTGTLLASTSTPLWATAPRLLPALFGASAASTAAAALTLTLPALGASEEEHEAVGDFALVAAGAELALLTAAKQNWRAQAVDEPLRQEPAASTLRLGVLGLGILVPLAVHAVGALTGRRSRTASVAAAVSTLVGGFLLRRIILNAGNDSGRRPQDYFTITQAPESPALEQSDELPREAP